MAVSLSTSPSSVSTPEDALAVVEELMEHIKVMWYTLVMYVYSYC